MSSFEFASPQRIIFGPGKIKLLPQLVAELVPLDALTPRRVLFVTGKSNDRALDALAALQSSEPNREFHHAILNVANEPTPEEASSGVLLAAETRAQLVIAIGGGSAIDCAKAVAMLATNGGEPIDYMEVIGRGRKVEHASLPLIAIPTTAGTGAEVTRNAVLTAREQRVKVSLRALSMLPRVALIDPMLALSVPRDITAATGLDALTQCLEPYISVSATSMTDTLALDGLRLASRSLRRAFTDGSDVSARTDMALCALYGGLALANAKLGAVHGFAGVLGGMFKAPHGMLCAALLAPVMTANVSALQQRPTQSNSSLLSKFTTVAQVLTGDVTAKPEAGVHWIQSLCADLKVPRLRTYGVDPSHFQEIAQKAALSSSMKGNSIELTLAELVEILDLAQ